ncbi:MAG: AIR synthase family protein [Chloroflexi bacterium]|nr:AIR synthase family protein [Chloroflexota bacterium]
MQAGKLPLEFLSKLLGKIRIDDPRVALGARPGEDAALIDFGDRYLVAKTDPITFATDLIGWYVVQVNANDLACMGATPRWLMATLLLPEGTTQETVKAIFGQILEACEKLGVTLIGGHTEITYGLPRPIAVGAMLGEAAKDSVVLTSGARPGDSIVLTQGVAIEGTAILAREAEPRLLDAGVSSAAIARAKDFLFEPGISVVKAASIACDTVSVHAMHDPTEGGLATGLLELARAANVGLVVDAERIPILPECRAICEALGLAPLGLIASGALLATVAPQDAPELVAALSRQGIPSREIGRVTPPEEGLKLKTPSGTKELPAFERDELARFFGESV